MLEPTKKRITKDVVELCFKVPATRANELLRMVSEYLKACMDRPKHDFVPWEEVYPDFDAGTAIRGARAREGITQVELSSLTGIPQRHISEMENGKRPVGKETAKRLAKALSLDYRVFL